ncbi:MAG: phosphatidate cytidylyltransferase [Thermoanaerobaculia bacterium]|nr:phosphatidate cytidylyltransferase [Thermoanaerobaculia bacterium]
MNINPNLVTTLLALFMVLSLGSLARWSSLRGLSESKARAKRNSLRTWWILAVLFALAAIFGNLGVCVLLGVASWVSLREYESLTVEDADTRTVPWLLALVPITYLAVFLGKGPEVLLGLPLVALVIASTSRVLQGRTEGYLAATGRLLLGMIVLVFGPAHAALLLTLPEATPLAADGVGWFVFLLLLTEVNDIAQALVGRRLGKHHITPEVSPHKTGEGFLGGLVVTVLVAILAAPYLTSLASRPSVGSLPPGLGSILWPALAGVVIAVAGFLGDLNMSAIKRDIGVKDSSRLLPGMGGALDRIDSLTLSAPSFYWFVLATAG